MVAKRHQLKECDTLSHSFGDRVSAFLRKCNNFRQLQTNNLGQVVWQGMSPHISCGIFTRGKFTFYGIFTALVDIKKPSEESS